MYNPMQNRLDSLMQQRQMIDQQMQALQNYQSVPPININNNMQPNQMPTNTNFDFNGKWVSDEQEAKGVASNNLPLILFDKNEPVFYMKNMDGSFKKFKFEEVEQMQSKPDSRIDALEDKLNAILGALSQTNINTPENKESRSNALKNGSEAKKGK